MFKLLLVIIIAVFFVNPVKADTINPFFITDVEVNTAGFTKPVSPFDTYPHKVTIEVIGRVNSSSQATSHVIQISQPTLDDCIKVLKRVGGDKVDLRFDPFSGTGINSSRRAYCTPAMQGAE